MISFRDQIEQGISFKAFPSHNTHHNFEALPFSTNTNSKSKLQSLSSFSSKIDLNSTKASSRNQFFRSYTNQMSYLLNDENEESPYTNLERIPSIELAIDEPLSSQGTKKKTNKLKIMVDNRNSGVVRHVRTCTSIGGNRPKVLLTSMRGGESSAQLAQNRSPLSTSGQSHFMYKKSTAKPLDRGGSTSRIKENPQEKTWRITTQRGVLKLPKNPRESRINKILEEVQEKLDNQMLSYGYSKGYGIGNTANTEITMDNSSPKASEVRVKNDEFSNQKLGIVDISRKLNDYRTVLSTQLVDLQKAKPYLHSKNKSFSQRHLFSRAKNDHSAGNEQDTLQKREQIKKRFAKTINIILRKLANMNLTIDEIITNKVFSTEPYQRQGSKLFFESVKNSNSEEIKRFTDRAPYLVYDFDPLKQTALHWAAKRGYAPIVKLLLERGADYDAQDLSGRTPLFLAAKGGFLSCVKLLLLFGADPTIKSGAEKLALNYADDVDIRNILKKWYKIHTSLSVYSHKKFKQKWNLLDKRDFEVKKEELLE